MRRWEEEHDDPNTEPYTVVHIRKEHEILYRAAKMPDGEYTVVIAPGGTYNFHVFYRTYTRRTWMSVAARDELEAFMVANRLLARHKRAADRRRKTTSTS